jgi:DNA replication protein DnaC
MERLNDVILKVFDKLELTISKRKERKDPFAFLLGENMEKEPKKTKKSVSKKKQKETTPKEEQKKEQKKQTTPKKKQEEQKKVEEKETVAPKQTVDAKEQLWCELFNSKKGNLNKKVYDCPECKNRGYFMKINERGYTVSVPCKCMKQRAFFQRMMDSGLYSFARKKLDNFQTTTTWQKELLDLAYCYFFSILFTKENPWFFFGGQPGCGKTHLCSALTVELARYDFSVYYMLWKDETTKIKSVITNYDEYSKLINKLKKIDILYIDDFFKTSNSINSEYEAKPTSADVNLAFEILNYRYNQNLPTIISSEKTIAKIAAIDESLVGRIFEKSRIKRTVLTETIDKIRKIEIKSIPISVLRRIDSVKKTLSRSEHKFFCISFAPNPKLDFRLRREES